MSAPETAADPGWVPVTRTYTDAPLLPPYTAVRAVWVHGSARQYLRLTGPPAALNDIERKHHLTRRT